MGGRHARCAVAEFGPRRLRKPVANGAAGRDARAAREREADRQHPAAHAAACQDRAAEGQPRRLCLGPSLHRLPRSRATPGAPPLAALETWRPEAIINALMIGKMKMVAIGMQETEARDIAAWITREVVPQKRDMPAAWP
jgi:hypothetical protein